MMCQVEAYCFSIRGCFGFMLCLPTPSTIPRASTKSLDTKADETRFGENSGNLSAQPCVDCSADFELLVTFDDPVSDATAVGECSGAAGSNDHVASRSSERTLLYEEYEALMDACKARRHERLEAFFMQVRPPVTSKPNPKALAKFRQEAQEYISTQGSNLERLLRLANTLSVADLRCGLLDFHPDKHMEACLLREEIAKIMTSTITARRK